MKKITIAAIVIILCLVFLCLVFLLISPFPYVFEQDTVNLDNIEIEIVNLETEMGLWAGEPYDEANVTVISRLTNEQERSFLSEFKRIICYRPNFGGRIDAISGNAVRVTYSDGQVELLTSNGVAVVTDGRILVHTNKFNQNRFDKLIRKYS